MDIYFMGLTLTQDYWIFLQMMMFYSFGFFLQNTTFSL